MALACFARPAARLLEPAICTLGGRGYGTGGRVDRERLVGLPSAYCSRVPEKPSIEHYLDEVADASSAHPDWREGQTYFNVLRAMRPDLVEEISAIKGSAADPYTVGLRLPAFLAWLDSVW